MSLYLKTIYGGEVAIFSNREIAVGIWLTLFAIWGFSRKPVRQSFGDLLKAFLSKPVLTIFALMTVYVVLIVLLLKETGLWESEQIKDTIMWFMFVAAVMICRVNTISEDDHFFRNAFFDNLKLIVVLEFIINVHSLSLWLELLLVPFSTLLVGMLVIAESDEKYKQTEKLINGVLIIMGLWFLVYAGYRITTDFNSFATVDNLRDFTLPPIMSTAYLPFVYFIALFMTYEILFIRLGFFIKDPHSLKYAKLRTITSMNVNLSELKRWGKHISSSDLSSKDSVDKAINEFRERNERQV